jgi:molecular chaperone DnaJ
MAVILAVVCVLAMNRDFYSILGVARTASVAEIHEAYRRLARAFHPDRSGADTASDFREVQQAWETLRDFEQRRAYDEQLRQEPALPRRRRASHPEPTRAGWGRAEPDHAADALHLELQMTWAEAARGGDVAVDLPARCRCGRCAGSGAGSFGLCPACWGRGYQVGVERFQFHVPPGLSDGAVVRVSLREYGGVHDELVIHVRIVR